MKGKLDSVDYEILFLLSENAQMAYTEVAKKVSISPGTVHMRMRKLKDLGVVTGATLNIDYSKIGWNLTIFIGVFLKETSLYKEVVEELKGIPEIVKINHTTGKYDLFIKMHAKDTTHYREVYQEAILGVNGIKGVESFMSVEENMNRHISFDN